MAATSSQPARLPRGWVVRRSAALVCVASLSALVIGAAAALHVLHAQLGQRVEATRALALEWSAERVAARVAGAPAEIARLAVEAPAEIARPAVEAPVEIARSAVEAPAEIARPASGGGLGAMPDAPALQSGLAPLLGRGPIFSALVVLGPAGEVRATAGSGDELSGLLSLLRPKDAVGSELLDVMEGAQLRRELAGVAAPALRLFGCAPERACALASAPLPTASGEAPASLHGVLSGELLAAQLQPELLGGDAALVLGDAEGRLIAAAGSSGSVGDLTGSRPIEGLGWTLVARQPLAAAYAPLLVASTRALVAGLAVVALFTLLASSRAAAGVRPLDALLEGLRRVARDETDVDLPVNRVEGPLEPVYRAFNAMSERLREGRDHATANLAALEDQNSAFQRQHDVLARMSVTDGLTELHNHRYFQDQLSREIKRLARTGQGLSMLILDIDDFKQLNDNFGHAAGDEFLKQLARILKEMVRETDLVARYGGEEFVILVPGTGLEGAAILGEKLRTAIAEATFIVDASKRPRGFTVSIGVAQFKQSRTELFTAADAALYRAKAAGKNCVVVAEPDDTGD
jgi:diguanylate cyclase (GGDEF)-like protein